MDPLHFAYWLNGFAETNTSEPTPEQWKMIKEHLATVFKKETPELTNQLARIQRGPVAIC